MRKISKKIIASILIFLPILAILGTQLHLVKAQPAAASLTGNIFDRGLDENGDGLFDFLEISVEINVTDPAEYKVYVSGLVGNDSSYWWFGQSQSAYLDPGIRRINVTLYGPQIYDQRINPENVSTISLSEIEYSSFGGEASYWLGDEYDIPLSGGSGSGGIYVYTEFNSPFRDAEAKFIVYPNGTVTLAGRLDYANMVPLNTGPSMQGAIRITEDGSLVIASVDSSMEIPVKEASEFPFNSTILSMLETYSDGDVQSELNVTMGLPSGIAAEYPFNTTDVTLVGTYSDGTFNFQLDFSTVLPSYVTSVFPFNTTDSVSVTGDYSDGVVEGTITFHFVSGLPLGDITIDFQGNETDLSLTSDITFIYDVPMPFEAPPPFPEFPLNRTTLDEWLLEINSSITGIEQYSLYNMTMGLFECTQFITTPTYRITGADVTFNVSVHGNFIETLALIMSGSAQNTLMYPFLNATLSSVDSASFQAAYTRSSKQVSTSLTFAYDVRSLVNYLAAPEAREPLQIPPEIPWQLINLTFSMVKDASLKLEYSSANKEIQVYLTATESLSEYWDEIAVLLPDIVPIEAKPYIELLLNTTYCSLESYSEKILYHDGIVDIESTYTIEGDFNAEINHVKEVAMNLLTMISGVPQLSWQIVFLNQTAIDITAFQVDYDLGNTSLTFNFSGLTLTPPIDPADSNPAQFKLERFFNLTADSLFPSSEEQLRITVEGASNVTHAVTLVDTGGAPTPNQTGPSNSYMIWYNQSISSIKDLTFQIGSQAYAARVLVIDQVGDPMQDATVKVYWPNGTLYKSLTSNDFGYTTSFTVDYEYMPYGKYNITATCQGVSAAKSLIISYSGIYTIDLPTTGSQKTETITDPDSVNATNPFVIDATDKTSSELIITEIDKPVEVTMRNMTSLPEGVDPLPGTFKLVGNYVEIIANETDATVNATIRIYYTPEEVAELGLIESSLQICYWNATEGKWIPVESQVNTDEHYVWAVVSHFSIWAIMGQLSPFWTQFWFIALIACVIALIIAVGVVYTVKKKKKTEQ